MNGKELMNHLDKRIDRFREEWERGGDPYAQGYADGMDYVYALLYEEHEKEERKEGGIGEANDDA